MSEQLITEEFLDTYEGEVLFLSQDLEELVEEIQEGDFTQESLELLNQKILDVSDVFLSSRYTQHVSPIFKEFADMLALMKCEDFKKLDDALEYLCEIVSDINTYINQYFVERSFTDVYLFQDSLKNSIDFLQRSYTCELDGKSEDDGSMVLFLND
ncbi:MAG: hypothetical protein COA44_14305 [Arcobacter sp.]|nr:MAG: hypothetical protein COA44_14305 [Arcobacter sp.]